VSLPFPNGGAEAAGGDGFVPNAFIRIDGDGQIVLTMPYVEMGQGTYTSISMLIDTANSAGSRGRSISIRRTHPRASSISESLSLASVRRTPSSMAN
jgi:CO/xanthine dehydrogenase Mo-binding subunit